MQVFITDRRMPRQISPANSPNGTRNTFPVWSCYGSLDLASFLSKAKISAVLSGGGVEGERREFGVVDMIAAVFGVDVSRRPHGPVPSWKMSSEMYK